LSHLVVARAAFSLRGCLRLVLDRVHNFNERWAGSTSVDGDATCEVGLSDGKLNILGTARAALRLFTSSLLALQLALGLSTVGGLDTFVEAGELLAHRLALGFRGLAGGVAVSRLANRLALGAALLLALILGAANGADWFLAVNCALGAGGLLALHLAFGSLAHRVANRRASGVIALPFALRVALFG
jgi:hypothetical protein